MPFLPNLAVFLGISVWYLVPTYWIVVIYRFIESNLDLAEIFGIFGVKKGNFGGWKKVEKNIYFYSQYIFTS